MNALEARVETLVGTGKAARQLEVSEVSVRRWVEAGRLKAVRTQHGLLFDPAEVMRFQRERTAR